MKLGPEGEADYHHQGLTGIPGDIPSDAKRVFLNHNQQAQGPKTPRPITVHFKKSPSSSALEVGMRYLL